nr:leaf rust 10 disease-resistance locus receptor-like protein kinase-like 1.2 isoform X1 [Tanacetum cinerariifolium]
MSRPLLLLLFFFITTIAAAETNTSDFQNCLPTDCHGLKISYPFWNKENQTSTQICGYENLGINCSTIDGQVRPMMYFGGDSYHAYLSNERLDTYVDALRTGFELSWRITTDDCHKCEDSNGRCGHNNSTGLFLCFCSDGTSTRSHCKVIIIFTLLPILSLGQYAQQFIDCSTKLYSCGPTIRWIGYPFWGQDRPSYCGLNEFHLACVDNAVTTLTVNNTTFRVLSIDQNNTKITLASNDIWGQGLKPNACLLRQHESINNTTFEYTVFSYIPEEFLFLGVYLSCLEDNDDLIPVKNRLNCSEDENGRMSFVDDETNSLVCNSKIRVPVLRTLFDEFNNRETMPAEEILAQGFPMEYRVDGVGTCTRCESSGGTCWSSLNSSVPSCLCPDGIGRLICPRSGKKPNLVLKILIGVFSGIFGVCLMCVVFYFYRRRRNNKERYYGSSYMSRKISSYGSSITDPEKSEAYHGVQIFKYRELEKATNHFDAATELGDGGFGTVYQGKLKDGRVVAVKRLYENNYKRVEQFMNEVGILAHLRHQNLVSLYGCTTHHSRELLLVYEYIPNGTVADHLHGDKSKPGSLTWTTRMSIAIETASALVYLHASDVIHRDVKTNNILLDNSFTVKVADFGLSRLFPNNVTHVSTAPQGTPGYVDPEYHNCYQLTSRSDVYSFGVVLIELISSKPAVDITRHRHEINLSNMALNKIRNDELHELVDPSLGFETDYEVRKMISAVAELAFQCLQNERDLRPSMDEVLEGLIGIQNGNYNNVKQDVFDGTCDDAVLLKDNSQKMSPDSVAIAWSTSTISTSSG